MIKEPYSIEEFINKVKGESDWEADEFEHIRTNIKEYLRRINNNKCFYCKTIIPLGNNTATIEHIIGKSKYPQFTYHPKNLTYLCPTCNRLKQHDEVLIESLRNKVFSYDEYPFDSSNFIHIHPYLDEYEEYIDTSDIFYVAKLKNTEIEKGINTIKLYHLDRLLLIEDKVRRFENCIMDLAMNASNEFANEILKELSIDDMIRLKELSSLNGGVGFDLASYIDNKIYGKNKLDEGTIECILELNKEILNNYIKFKEIIKELLNLDRKSLNDTLRSNIDLYADINFDDINKIISLISNIVNYKDDRKKIKCIMIFTTIKELEDIEEKYSLLNIESSNNIQLSLLFKIKYIFKLLSLYDFRDNIDEIKKMLRADKLIIDVIEKELNKNISGNENI